MTDYQLFKKDSFKNQQLNKHKNVPTFYLSIYELLQSFVGPWPLFQFLNPKHSQCSRTVHGGPYGCDTSRLPYFLNNRLTDGGEVVKLKRRPPFSPRKIPGTHFC
jgi:hypothetical protein